MKTLFTKITMAVGGFFMIGQSFAAEFFVKINRPGQHTVLVDDQYQTNNVNIYRFFDLKTGTLNVKISDANTGNLVYDGKVTLTTNQRVVAEMDAKGGLTTINTSTVTYTNWYTQANTTVTVTTPPPPPPTPPAPAGPVAVSNQKFNEIKKIIDDQMMDQAQCDKAKSIMKKNFMTTKQIIEICKLFDFDSYKLDYAKFAYDYCVDKSNYYEVSTVFIFDSYGKELDEYVDKKN